MSHLLASLTFDGCRFIDCARGMAVLNTGHVHPHAENA